jgi:hypothetical protein
MPRAKISEFSTIPGDNTDIDGINIAEGCAPSGINDAIRELMAQLKDFQSGAAGDSITVVGTLAAKGTSSSGADLKLYEDTDNGTNYVGFIAPASIASNVQWTLPSADGSSGQALQTNGSGTLSFATLGISAGGTGQTTANAAFNALAPSQTSNAGRYLKTDGTNTSWDLLDISTADITGTLPVANGGTGLTSFTANRVFYASSTSAIAQSANLTFDGTTLTANNFTDSSLTSGRVTYATTGGNLTDSANLTFDGTTLTANALTTTSTVTINGGTANGVAYLNGSKVLTTGSALTFNGTTLTLPSGNISIGSSTAGTTLDVFNGDAVNAQRLRLTTSGTNGVIQVTRTSGTVPNLIFQQDASELMRLTSTGLGIGTSSPGNRLHVVGSGDISRFTNGSVSLYGYSDSSGLGWFTNTVATGTGVYYNNTSNFQAFYTASTERMRLDSSGNLGLGVTPSAWGSSDRFIDVGNSVAFGRSSAGGGAVIAYNAFINSSGQIIYKVNAHATYYQAVLGQHQWFTAPSGTAGNIISFTQAMTLDASGNLLVGTTGSLARIAVENSAAGDGVIIRSNGFNTNKAGATNSLLLGSDYTTGISYVVAGGSSTNTTLAFYTAATAAPQERARITSVGNFSLGTHANRGTTVGTNALQIFNGTAPAGTLTNGVSLYSSSGDLFFMDAAGLASKVGFRGVPQSGSAKTGSYTLATSDVGEYIEVGSGGSITIPDATFATGDVVSIFNNTTGNITITCTITTAYIAGTDADKASVTLATRGVATILFISGTVCVISGNVS